jgi:hypothetical protein
MKVFIIKFLGFLLGFFITLIIINYISIENKKRTIENFFNPSSPTSPALNINYSNKYIKINTFDATKIKNTENRWLDSDDDNKYFTYNNPIVLKTNNINGDSGAQGANLNSIELRGPNSYLFANNPDTNELNNFSVYFAGKFNGITNTNNIIFEMVGNTESLNYPSEIKYAQSIVNINLFKNQNNNFDVIITVGNVIYKGLINNIDRNVIINADITAFYLTYSPTEIIFGINKQVYKYSVDNTAFLVKLGSTPVIINKGGNIDFDLYLFVYYKSVITFDEIQTLTRNTYSNLSGLEMAVNNMPKCDIVKKENTDLDIKLKEMENTILKSIENKNNEIKEKPKIDVKPLDLKEKEKENKKTGLFDWLF